MPNKLVIGTFSVLFTLYFTTTEQNYCVAVHTLVNEVIASGVFWRGVYYYRCLVLDNIILTFAHYFIFFSVFKGKRLNLLSKL